MAELINLNKARKAKAKADAAARASVNRTRHGRSKAEKARDAKQADTLERALDGHRREDRKD